MVISTPDHWHALQTIHACQAGKDVYVEKPISLRVAEGRAMVQAVKRNKRVCQSGLHRRSAAMFREMAECVRGGGLGRSHGVRTFHIQNEWPKGIGNPPDSPPPPGMDWEAWLGPRERRPYNRNRGLYQFRWFFDYSGGQITNNGIHYLDLIHWALGQEAPLAVTGMGAVCGRGQPRRAGYHGALWHYPGNTLVIYTQFNANGAGAAAKPCEIEFRGTKGTLYMRSNGWEVVPEVITPNEFPRRSPTDRSSERGWRTGEAPVIEARKESGRADTADHARNFRLHQEPGGPYSGFKCPRRKHQHHAYRQHCHADPVISGMGCEGGEVYKQSRGQQAPALRLPPTAQKPGLNGARAAAAVRSAVPACGICSGGWLAGRQEE